MSLVISTAWNAFRSTDAERMIAELKDLGFGEVELSFNLTSGMVDTVEELVRRGEITVSSIHNFCPVPEGLKREEALPDFFSMSSADEAERKRSVECTKASIDTACRLNAKAVVLHCGRVEVRDIFKELVKVYAREGADNAEFRVLRSAMIDRRRERARPYLENTLRSLDELNSYAAKREMRLGVETRYYYTEIPSLEEFGVIMGAFKGGMVRYWHDVGHAQVAENLGLAKQEDFLDSFKDQLLGMHIHDVRGSLDHKAPATGDVDFKRFIPYITAQTIKVMEIHHPSPAQELISGRDFLKTVFDGKA
jgi:sugar phosphate isomerase/epimerase